MLGVEIMNCPGYLRGRFGDLWVSRALFTQINWQSNHDRLQSDHRRFGILTETKATTRFFPTLDELFRHRERALEALAGSLLSMENRRPGSAFQPTNLHLTASNPIEDRSTSLPLSVAPLAEMASGERGPSGPRLGIGLELWENDELQQRLELDNEARRQVETALHYWETKPHSEMKLSLAAMVAALGIPPKSKTGQALEASDFAAEFIVVSSRELKELDAEEKTGVLLGGCIIVSEDVPESYLPMVVANLAFMRKISDDNAFRQLVSEGKISVDESRHWTANVLDLVLAAEYFTDSPAEYAEFLRWRKQVERTDFFKNFAVEALLRQKLSYQIFKRTTHPAARSFYSKRSWVIGGLLHMLGVNASKNAKDLGVTKADIIVRELAGYRHEEFDPEYMLRFIQSLPELVQARKVGALKQNYVDLRNDPKLREQASLLTAEAVGRDSAILEEVDPSGIFTLKCNYSQSLRALSDRIVYFTREGLLHSGLTHKTLLFLRGVMALLAEVHARRAPMQSQSDHERAHIQIRMKEIGKQIEAIDASLEHYRALRIKYVDMEAVEYIPGTIGEQYRALLRLRDRLDGDMSELSEAYRFLSDAEKLFQGQPALLGAILATELHADETETHTK